MGMPGSYVRSTIEEKDERRIMLENYELMQPLDVLTWDSPSMHYDTRELYRLARARGWKVSISCTPPLITGYRRGVKGRMTITRIA